MLVNSRSIHGLCGCCERPKDGSLSSACWHCRNTADTCLKRRRIKMLTEHREGSSFFGREESGESFTEKRFERSLRLLWCMWGWEWERVKASFIQPPTTGLISQCPCGLNKAIANRQVSYTERWEERGWQTTLLQTCLGGWTRAVCSHVFSIFLCSILGLN